VLGAAERWRLWKLVDEHNDDTLEELRQRGGFTCSLTTIWRELRRRGLTRKKKSPHAEQRERPDVQAKRRSFRRRVRRVEPGRLRFVDESGVNKAMTRAYAWAPRGQRAVGKAPAKWASFTTVAARSKETLDTALGEALERVTPQDIIGWFQHAGLCATHG
jgi:hypothetical protein